MNVELDRGKKENKREHQSYEYRRSRVKMSAEQKLENRT
jgi:hypothetical protein